MLNKILKVMAIVILLPLFTMCSLAVVSPFVGIGAAVVLPAVQEYEEAAKEAEAQELER